MDKPTKVTITAEGRIEEFAAVHSVELTNTVKDGWRVSGVKIYSNDPKEAARIAVETALYADRLVREAQGKDA